MVVLFLLFFCLECLFRSWHLYERLRWFRPLRIDFLFLLFDNLRYRFDRLHLWLGYFVAQKGHELLCHSICELISYLCIGVLIVVRASAHHALSLVKKSRRSAIWVRTLIHEHTVVHVFQLDVPELSLLVDFRCTFLDNISLAEPLAHWFVLALGVHHLVLRRGPGLLLFGEPFQLFFLRAHERLIII